MDIKLPPNWFDADFLGFALSFVLAFDNYTVKEALEFGWTHNFKPSNGESLEFHDNLHGPFFSSRTNYGEGNFNSDHVFVWYNRFNLLQGSKCSSTVFCHTVTEASVKFYQIDPSNKPVSSSEMKVTKCGVCLLYAKDAEKLDVKFRELIKLVEDKQCRGCCGESEASGSETLTTYRNKKMKKDQIFM
ncbi:hypothetical protein DVH24_010244 [Malus domestica]|uniref:C-JID domain-containing protein n=1 Tax=Malus domestica TaxID=3750 RepID=A0A498JPQ1_MALDO|nr:hypothetical protein DVH24_010244 [Malus domestica]